MIQARQIRILASGVLETLLTAETGQLCGSLLACKRRCQRVTVAKSVDLRNWQKGTAPIASLNDALLLQEVRALNVIVQLTPHDGASDNVLVA